MRRRDVLIFTSLNLAILLSCFEQWREEQPLNRMVVVGLISVLVINPGAWLSLQRSRRR
jgi:hypothetical protein